MELILFHGTADYSQDAVIKSPRKRPRRYLPDNRAAFCCSASLKEAGFFALRRTPSNDLTKTGVVIEFSGNLRENFEYNHAVCPGMLRNEHEIVVYTPGRLKAVAIWHFNHKMSGKPWIRRKIRHLKVVPN